MKRSAAIIIVALMALLSGCASTKQAKDIQPSGFLAEYASLLRPSREDEAGRLYRNPDINWAAYRRILLEPVMVWGDATSTLSNQQREDLQRLIDSLYHTLALKLSKDYEIVETPVSGTMRIQAAITYGEAARTELMLVSKVIPQAQAANLLWTFASGKPTLAGEVTIEFIVKDARTGNLLAAGVDRRTRGTNPFAKKAFTSWGDVKDSLEFWTDASVYRLCLLRGGPTCIKPKE